MVCRDVLEQAKSLFAARESPSHASGGLLHETGDRGAEGCCCVNGQKA